jgi:hypothetical protein
LSSNLTTEQKLDKIIEFLETVYGPNIIGDKPEPQPPIVKPAEGTVKEGGWGAIENPNTWKVVKMRDYPDLFKIVDAPGKNVATNFTTEAIAEQYIKYFKSQWEQDDDPQENEPGAEEKPAEPSQPVTDGDGPYKMKAGSKEVSSSTRGPTIRHYASGKDDDKTIEKNCKDIKFKNYQFLVDVKLTTIEHNDTVSLKYGGTHMKSGWFDNTVDMESGQVGLGVEKKHPSADLEIIKGTKIGSILNKKIRLAGVYFKDQNKCEMWTNLGDGWKKGAEGTDVGKFNPKSEINEAQLRIDGFEDEPEITRAVVQEIEV